MQLVHSIQFNIIYKMPWTICPVTLIIPHCNLHSPATALQEKVNVTSHICCRFADCTSNYSLNLHPDNFFYLGFEFQIRCTKFLKNKLKVRNVQRFHFESSCEMSSFQCSWKEIISFVYWKNKTHKEVEMKENCLLLQMYLCCEFSLGLLWIWLLKWEWQPNNRRTLCLPAALCCFHFIFNLWPNSYEFIQVYLQSICFLWEYEGILFVCLFVPYQRSTTKHLSMLAHFFNLWKC